MSAGRIAMLIHPSRDVQGAVRRLRAWAQAREIDVVQVRLHGDEPPLAREGGADGAALVVAVGGDGTVLAALRVAAEAGPPVLGVACGSLGALATVAASGVERALDSFEAGDWTPHRIPALEVRTGEATAAAINDLVVVRAGGGQVSAAVELDGTLYGRFAGDGAIVSTQLGSSAYALAAGGPVIAPAAEAWLVTPLAPHGGFLPPLVVGAGARVRLTVDPGHGGARVEIDGQPTRLAPAVFDLSLRTDFATLVRVGEEESFLAGLRRRRILMDSPRMLARNTRLPG